MIDVALGAALILFCAWLNRFRGSGYFIPFPNGRGFAKTDLPGGPAIFPSLFLLIGLYAYQLTLSGLIWVPTDIYLAAAFAMSYMLWAMLPSDWGESHDMGRSQEPTNRGTIGKLVEWIIEPPDQPKFDLVVWSIRNLWVLLLLPVAFLSDIPFWVAAIVAVSLAVHISFVYWLAMRPLWRFRSWLEPTTVAESLAGAGWGVAAICFA